MTFDKREAWLLKNERGDEKAIAGEFGISPITARVMINRGFSQRDAIRRYLDGNLADLHPPEMMKDMEKGCAIMQEKIQAHAKIRIVSDYDVDGITSNCILYRGLREAGADVSYDIPDRIRDGYGINERIVDCAYADGVDTIITCDNGIAAMPAVDRAKKLGMTVIVTDHHEVPCRVMEDGNREYLHIAADAVIDPHQPDCPYPYKDLCGAGVAYKFIRCLYRRMGLMWEEERFLDLVALGTVCDIMPLTGENRILVKYGLQTLTNSKNIGICALKEALGLNGKPVEVYHLGFRIGPCLNSTGRLESAKEGVELLLTEDKTQAAKLASAMAELNKRRKDMTEQGVDEAIRMIHAGIRLVPSADGAVERPASDDSVLVLYLPDIHESVAGLVASKIKERFYRPVLVLTDAENGGGLKGSGRSIEAYDMFAELSRCRELFVHMGGHPMAAGFTIPMENFELLRSALNANQTLTEQDMTEKYYIDASIPLSQVTQELYEELSALEPYGTANKAPLFGLLNMCIRRVRMVGDKQQYARCEFATESGSRMSGMVFQGKELLDCIKEWFGSEECDKILNGFQNRVRVDILYHIEKNVYRDRVTMQIRPVSIRPHKR